MVRVLTPTPITKANAKMQEPQGDDERLDLQRGEVHHQVHLPQSFVFTNTIHTSMDTSNPKRGSIITTILFVPNFDINGRVRESLRDNQT
jgi:hypothetical protein